MDISSICISNVFVSGFGPEYVHPEINIVKSLPMLSVVQSLHGNYRIGLESSAPVDIPEGCVFVAPANVTQHINEFPGSDGRMTVHWVFFDVELNGQYKLDDAFSFPLMLPPAHNGEISELIERARARETLAARMPYLSRLVEILLENARPNEKKKEDSIRLQTYIEENLPSGISEADLCAVLHCSRSAMYPLFRKLMGESPTRYINNCRISRAQSLLLHTDKSVADIASAVGIHDQFYFSRLFRNITGISAGEYRKLSRRGK
ncbi:MAG: AraC family transcriptional regulator [Clostridia bacterium]|nr:AraC family transcriptional regulator [Clostridia bacterium]